MFLKFNLTHKIFFEFFPVHAREWRIYPAGAIRPLNEHVMFLSKISIFSKRFEYSFSFEVFPSIDFTTHVFTDFTL